MEAFIPIRTADPLPGTRILALNAKNPFQVVERIEQGFSPASAERLTNT